MHSAAVYQLKDRILIHPWQRTTMGLGIASAPYVSLPTDVDPSTLGNAVFNALTHSDQMVPHPTSWTGLATQRLKAAGVKSERAFVTAARSLSIERAANGLRIEPSRNGGSKGNTKGFEPLPELGMLVAAGSDATTVGDAVRACFERCA